MPALLLGVHLMYHLQLQGVWGAFSSLFMQLYQPTFDALALEQLDCILVLAFRHPFVAATAKSCLTAARRSTPVREAAVLCWNGTFGKEVWLSYTDELASALRLAIRGGAAVMTPGLEQSPLGGTSTPPSPPRESQPVSEVILRSPVKRPLFSHLPTTPTRPVAKPAAVGRRSRLGRSSAPRRPRRGSR